ncbi:MAG: glucoamylase family protein [Chthoniobacterales bacterium]
MTGRADRRMLHKLQRETFDYFWDEANPANGLIPDKTQENSPATIAATGFALAIYPIAVERGFIQRAAAIKRTLATLRFFWKSPQSDAPDATGYHGFYYHYLEMESGRRAWQCELSTIDSAFLFAGMLTAAQYFNADNAEEREIRELVASLYRRADWRWMLHGGKAIGHGWKPRKGFLKYRWQGYSEALILYFLALGSPTYSVPQDSYQAWASTYRWKKFYDHEFLYAGPLFIHQLSHMWIDFRGIQDEFMRGKKIDYFENSRRATYIQQAYAIKNPRNFKGYDKTCWGITASDGPGATTRRINGVKRRFYDYIARGVPHGPDDGTLAPWAVVASLPFAPEIVLPTVHHFSESRVRVESPYGFKATFNETFPGQRGHKYGWVSPWHLGLNQGPIVMMVENYRSGLLWKLMRQCEPLVTGLRRAGFTNGWLGEDKAVAR